MTTEPLEKIVCCIGRPVAGTPLQYMMAKAFAAAGLDWRYLTLEVAPDDLADAVRGLRAMGFCGADVLSPHKIAVAERLDELTDTARLVGAANCVWREGRRLLGDSTEGRCFVAAIRERIDPAGRRVVILGAGGAARSIAVELVRSGAAHVTVVNRSAERGQALADLLTSRLGGAAAFVPWEGEYRVPDDADLLIHATSVSAVDDRRRIPLRTKTLRPELVVADVTLTAGATPLLEEAAARGCPTCDGVEMLLREAAEDFIRWTSVEPDRGVLRDALEEFFLL